MKENTNFIVIFTAMMLTIIYLSGCTRMASGLSKDRHWEIRTVSLPDGSCEASVIASGGDSSTDESITLDKAM